jgi:hypothetical protein
MEDSLCGCGRRFRQCPVWIDVFERAFGGQAAVDPRALVAAERSRLRVRQLPRLLGARWHPALLSAGLERYTDHLARLYPAVAAATGAEVIVDSSKLPSYGYVLQTVGAVDLYVLHLVRDPRGAAWSWRKRKARADRGGAELMGYEGPAKSAALWSLWNGMAEAMWSRAPARYLRLRYEDLISRPRESVERVLAMLGRDPGPLDFVGERSVRLQAGHTVAGNPNRLDHGEVPLRLDQEWVGAMGARDRLVVTALTAPLLARYRYPFRRPAPAP